MYRKKTFKGGPGRARGAELVSPTWGRWVSHFLKFFEDLIEDVVPSLPQTCESIRQSGDFIRSETARASFCFKKIVQDIGYARSLPHPSDSLSLSRPQKREVRAKDTRHDPPGEELPKIPPAQRYLPKIPPGEELPRRPSSAFVGLCPPLCAFCALRGTGEHTLPYVSCTYLGISSEREEQAGRGAQVGQVRDAPGHVQGGGRERDEESDSLRDSEGEAWLGDRLAQAHLPRTFRGAFGSCRHVTSFPRG